MSFQRMELYYNEVQKVDMGIKILVGNKQDLVGTKKSYGDVKQAEAQNFAQKYGMEFFETSCENNEGITALGEFMTTQCIQMVNANTDPGMLMGKGVAIGIRLLTNPTFKLALFDPKKEI